MMSKFFGVIMLVGALVSLQVLGLHAQSNATPIECGQIVEAETNPNDPVGNFEIQAPAGTTLNGRVEPLGSTLNVSLWFTDVGGSVFAQFNENAAGVNEQFSEFTVASSNPILLVGGVRPDSTGQWFSSQVGHFGAFTIYLGCTLRDGTVINPGDTNVADSGTGSSVTPFSGTGFPGLAPIDFADAVVLPFNAAVPNPGSITPGFSSVFGYSLTSSAGDVMQLDFTRTSGNLNLGLVVMSPDNRVVFQASLVTADTLSTRFTLPVAGEYTIGVSRIDLIPPDAPENTTFEIAATINP